MTMAFLSSCRTVSEGWAPTASHFLMAGAFRFVSFRSGSYQPRFCIQRRSVDWRAETETTTSGQGQRTAQYTTLLIKSLCCGCRPAGKAQLTSMGRPSRRDRESMAMMR